MRNKKILIIDDEKDFGFLMKSFFSPKNFDVSIAYTLAEGMRMLATEEPDIIFLDNNLPDGLGWEKTEYILIQHPSAQLNLISALKVPQISPARFTILEKPLHFEDLLKAIEQ
ncbi:MAG: response regulator [Cytophagales bacterium]|nr:response regulator [Cytophagales bacterium]